MLRRAGSYHPGAPCPRRSPSRGRARAAHGRDGRTLRRQPTRIRHRPARTPSKTTSRASSANSGHECRNHRRFAILRCAHESPEIGLAQWATRRARLALYGDARRQAALHPRQPTQPLKMVGHRCEHRAGVIKRLRAGGNDKAVHVLQPPASLLFGEHRRPIRSDCRCDLVPRSRFVDAWAVAVGGGVGEGWVGVTVVEELEPRCAPCHRARHRCSTR